MVDRKLDVARQLGATDVVNGSETDAVEAVKEITGGGVDYAFEAIGLKHDRRAGLGHARPGGTATIIGMMPFGRRSRSPATRSSCRRRCCRAR